MKKKFIAGVAIALSAIALAGCNKTVKPNAAKDESHRAAVHSQDMLYIEGYTIDITLDPDSNTVQSLVTAEIENNTDQTLDTIILRNPVDSCLKNNSNGLSWELLGAYLGKDTSSPLEASIDSNDSSQIKVELGDNKLEPDSSIMFSVEVKEDIPYNDPRFGYVTNGKYNEYILSSCFPQVAEYRDGNWITPPIDWSGTTAADDFGISQVTDFHVTVHAPEDYVAIGSGAELSSENGTTTIEAVDMREFATVVSNGFRNSYWSNDIVTVSYYYLEGAKDNDDAIELIERLIPIGFDWLESNVEDYPWNQYDLVQIYNDDEESGRSFPGFSTYPGKIYYDGLPGSEKDDIRERFSPIFTKGLVQQWFEQLTDSDRSSDGWMSKGLVTWFDDFVRANMYDEKKDRHINDIIQEAKEQHPNEMKSKLDEKLGSNISPELVNSLRGAEFIEDLYKELGEEEFLSAIKEFMSNTFLSEANSQDFFNAFKNHDNGNVDAIIKKYFNNAA